MKYIIIVFFFIVCSKVTGQQFVFSNKDYKSYCFSCWMPSKHKDSLFCGVDTVFCKWELDTEKVNLMVIETFNAGYKTNVTAFYENGQKYREVNFNKMKFVGHGYEWYKNGALMSIVFEEANQNKKIFMMWYDSGQFKTISDKNLIKNVGFEKTFYKSGELNSETEYIDSIPNAWIKRKFFENGQVSEYDEANFLKSYFAFYREDGKKIICGFSKKGLHFMQLGKWQEWYETGILKREYYFHDSIPNQKEDTWKWFDEKGNLTKEEYYKNGEKTGEKEYVPGKKQNEKMK